MAQAIAETEDNARTVQLTCNGSTFEVDLDTKRLRVNRRPVHLGEREQALLMYLVEFRGVVHSRKQLIQEMHDHDFLDFNDGRLTALVNVLRSTLNGSRAGAGALIQTQPDGYTIDA